MRKDIILSKGLHFTEQELELSAISPLPAELYVREKLDEEWIANLQALLREGLLEPQIVVGKVQNHSGLYIVEGHHTYHALKREGIKTVKALVLQEELDYITLAGLQIALNAVVQKPLTVKEKKALLLRLYLKYKQELGKDFWRQRREIINRLIEETQIPERTVYRLLEEELAQEKEELRKIALELLRAGNSQEKISQMLGVPQQTISDWIRNLSVSRSTFTENCQVAKIGEMRIFLNKETLNPAFMELFSRALEEGKTVEEFFKEKGGLFRKEEVEEFMRRLRKFLEKVVLRTYTLSPSLRRKGFAELCMKVLTLSQKACFALYEQSKSIYEEVEKTVKELEGLVEEVCEDNEVKNEDDARKVLKERLKGKAFALEYFDELYVGIKDKVKECLSKYPVLTVEEVLSHYSVEDLEKLSEEELREELLASFPTYKVPSSVVEDVYDRIRLPALLKEFEEGYYASIREFEERLTDRDRKVVLKFNDLFAKVLGDKKKGGEEDHKRWAKKMQEEGLDTETARKRAWQEEGIIITASGLQAYKASVQAEVKQEPTPSNEAQEQEEDISVEECAVRVGTKGFYRLIQTLIKQLKEVETLVEQGKTDKALKKLSKVLARLNTEKEKLEKKIEKQGKTLSHNHKVLYKLLRHIHDFSVKTFDLPVVFEGEEGKLLKILDKAVGRYEEILEQKGIDKTLEKNFDEFLPVFLETYAYAFLKARPTIGKFLANFINYRHEFSHTVRKQEMFITFSKEKKTYQDISALVQNYLGGVKDGA